MSQKRRWISDGQIELPGGAGFVERLTCNVADGTLRVMLGKEAGRWHLSISHPRRYPTWDEIADARYDLLSDKLTMVMVLPPPNWYVNAHPYVFHMWETRDPELVLEIVGVERALGERSRENEQT